MTSCTVGSGNTGVVETTPEIAEKYEVLSGAIGMLAVSLCGFCQLSSHHKRFLTHNCYLVAVSDLQFLGSADRRAAGCGLPPINAAWVNRVKVSHMEIKALVVDSSAKAPAKTSSVRSKRSTYEMSPKRTMARRLSNSSRPAPMISPLPNGTLGLTVVRTW